MTEEKRVKLEALKTQEEEIRKRKEELMKELEDVTQEIVNVKDDKELKIRISEIFREIGIPANLMGYHYAREAIILCYKDFKMLKQMTQKVYPSVGKKFDATWSQVERSIRHAIECGWDRGNPEVLDKYFGNSVDYNRGKPSNGEFIAMIVDFLKLEDE